MLEYFPGSDRVGAHFGVVLVHDEAGAQVEVATFRSDFDYSDGRRPDRVGFETDPKQDALRRDFTINALFEDPITGDVLDFVGGRRICAQAGFGRSAMRKSAFGRPPAYAEGDPVLRARLQFSIAPATFEAIRKLAELVSDVSAERVRGELIPAF